MTGAFDKDFERLLAFLKSGVDDRTLAIVCAAYADKYLGELIQYRLPGLNHALRTKMFHPSHGSLGSFGARIDMAKALQQIDANTFNDLKILASIRNRFAHELGITSVDDEVIAKRVSNFRAPRVHGATREAQAEADVRWASQHNRTKLQFAGMSICIALHNGLNSIRRLKEQGAND